MKPFSSFGAVLAVVSLALAAPTAKHDNLVDPQTLADSIQLSKLLQIADDLETLAYASPDKNRFIGTDGLDHTMQVIEGNLKLFDYYNISRDYFDFEFEGTTLKLYNLIAETLDGDHDNVLHLGAHMDSTPEGPGMNDNASGGIALIEIALQLALGGHTVNNAVRFSWWSAEEEGLIGSTHYVDQLSDEERQKIRLYLNFDMIASPAGDYGVYTSDFSELGIDAPPGVEEAEKFFQDYFDDVDLEWNTVKLRGNSDHWPFVEAGIPTSGLHAGHDPNYHTADDTVENMNKKVFIDSAKAIAYAVGTYGASFDSLPPRDSL